MEREKERPSQLDIAKSRWSYAVTMILETFGAQTALLLHPFFHDIFMWKLLIVTVYWEKFLNKYIIWFVLYALGTLNYYINALYARTFYFNDVSLLNWFCVSIYLCLSIVIYTGWNTNTNLIYEGLLKLEIYIKE